MKKLIFFDTETTGNTEKDFLCQIAYKVSDPARGGAGDSFTGLFKPPVKIPAEASAIHHITNKMVEELEAFKGSDDAKRIKEMFENPDTVVVAHNAPFDLAIIKKEEIIPKNFICTLRLARYLDKNEKLENYKLQYLRYALDRKSTRLNS